MLVVKLRRHQLLVPATCLLMALLLAACGQSPPLQTLPDEAVILAFGDSLTRGTGTSIGNSYPAELEKLLGRTVYNEGLPGEISSAGLRRLPGLLDEIQPDLVILCHGGNDILRRQDLDLTSANIAEMIALVRASGAQVVMLAVPVPGVFLSPAPFYEELASELKVVTDLDTITDLLKQPALKSDAVHLNAKGYRQLAQAVEELLRQHGAVN